MTRVIFISRINLSSGRTNVYNFTKTCEAVNSTDRFQAKLITTDQQKNTGDFFKRMGVTRSFEIKSLGITNTDYKHVGKKWYELYTILIANFHIFLFFITYRKEFDVIYFRDGTLSPATFLARLFLRKKVFFETHSVLNNKYGQLFNLLSVRIANGVVAISSGLLKHYSRLNSKIMLSFCSASEQSWAGNSHDREQLKLQHDKFIIGYAGVVGPNPNGDVYEIDDIIRSLVLLPKNVIFVIVGEMNGNAMWLRSLAKEEGVMDRVVIVPWKERKEIPKYLEAFDVILIPKRKKDLVGDSPAKMFSALATGRPIVAGRAECIEEVLTNGSDAIVVERNDPSGWADSILKLYKDPKLVEKISGRALITNSQYTWTTRGKKISDFIFKII